MSNAMRASFYTPPPTAGTQNAPIALALGTNDLAALLLAAGVTFPKGRCWLSLENPGTTSITVGFAATSGAATATNGAVIPPGGSRRFYIQPSIHLFAAVSAACSAYISSPQMEGTP